MVDVNKGHKFFSQNFTVEISTPVEYSAKNRIFALVGKGPKMTLDLEKCAFSANMGIIRLISLIFPKETYRHLF